MLKRLITRLIAVSIFASHLSAHADNRPNILLVLSDDQSAAHVGCYGNADVKTPNIDRFASEGLRFDRAYVASPQCVPSRAAIMTGRSPVATQMTRFSAPLPEDVKTYPEHLRGAGYFTGVAGRTFHLDGNATGESAKVYAEHSLRTFSRRLDFVKQSGQRSGIISQFEEFLNSVPQDRPFFLQLGFSDPHRPHTSEDIPTPHDPTTLKLPSFYPDTEKVRRDLANHYDEINRLDSDFGRVLSILDARGLTANTLVVFMGDNGSSQFRGKGTLYELGIRVPLIARWPRQIKAGTVAPELISGEDLAPTFLEAASVAIPAEITGRSFLKRLRGDSFEARKYVFSERGAHASSLPNNSAAFDLGRVVVSPKYKLIYNALWQIPYWPVDFASTPMWKELEEQNRNGSLSPLHSRLYFSPTRPMFELYDLEHDPDELNNLAGRTEVGGVESDLKAALHEWMILQRDYLPLPVPGEKAGRKRNQKQEEE